jgi:hypothetical protein
MKKKEQVKMSRGTVPRFWGPQTLLRTMHTLQTPTAAGLRYKNEGTNRECL